MKTIREALKEGASLLAGSKTPYLDASLLLADVLNLTKEKLFASYPDLISQEQYSRYVAALNKRKKNVPVAYILKKKEFFDLTFYVDERVLVPRPDTETLVETALSLFKKHPEFESVLDLCCGSGCIGITVKYALPECSVTCADISEGALEVCRYNSSNLLGEVLLTVKSDLFSALSGTYDMILSNPPYLKEAEVHQMNENVWPEPSLALDGGTDGLSFLRRIVEHAAKYLNPGGYLLLESAIDQTYYIEQGLIAAGFTETAVVQDLTGRNRVTLGRK